MLSDPALVEKDGTPQPGLPAMGNGPGSSVLGGQRDGEAVRAILDHHLDELLRSP